MSRSRAYCLTLNNYSSEELSTLLSTPCTYLLLGKEEGTEGTPHLQGYIYFPNGKTLSSLKKISPRAHWELAKGDSLQNYTYCSKDGDFEEVGTRPLTPKEKGQTQISKWASIKDNARQGKLDEIDPKIYVTHYRTLLAIAKDNAPMPPDAADTTGLWYWGASGTGKSRAARSEYPNAYLKMANKWWDGYKGEEVVIIEDFDLNHRCLGYHLKIWADRYAFPAEIKGGKINIRPKLIIVTSNYHPEAIWEDDNTLHPIERRFEIKLFS